MSEETTVALDRHLSVSTDSREDRIGAPRNKQTSSFPSGKDELRQVTVVREAWTEYQTKEKRFSKEFAAALIALHKHLAKPGSGTFMQCLNDLKIPPTTAYRLMQIHGWKSEKRTVSPSLKPEDRITLERSKAVVAATRYLNEFTGEKLRKNLDAFCEELRTTVLGEETA